MKRESNQAHRIQPLATADLATVKGGTFFRTNVWGELGAQLDQAQTDLLGHPGDPESIFDVEVGDPSGFIGY